MVMIIDGGCGGDHDEIFYFILCIRFHPKWCHVRCALWIPEVGVGNVDRMEPITKTELIPVLLRVDIPDIAHLVP